MNKVVIFVGIFFSFIGYILMGVYTLSTALETINGAKGTIWTQMQAGFDKLAAIESQLIGAYKDRKDIIQTIATARTGYTAAKKSGNIDQAISAASAARSNLNILVENYPSTDISTLQTGVLDETAGIFNRIAYARQQLINEQVSYNKNRILFFIVAPWFASQNILGAMEDPMASSPKSRFV